ncbi:MAG: ATP-binding protein [Acidimicrobiia bacterium]
MTRRREQRSATELEAVATDAVATGRRSRLQRDRLAAALAEITEGVIVIDGDGVEVFRNEAAGRFRDARHADAVAERAIKGLMERARAGERCEEELRLFGPPRSVLRVRAVPLTESDVQLGVGVLIQDVSDLDRVENIRRDFVANVSHELKTPIGALELLAETLAIETDPAVARPLAERLAKEADRLGQIVDDLLDLSLIEVQEAASRELLRADLLVEEALDRVRPAAAAAGIGLDAHERSPDVQMVCDHRQVVSAVTNLLDNAVKYSERGSVIEVSTSVDDDRVSITVRDQGIGIPSRDLERIFERFYRVDQARSRDTGGTGLGLAIVRHVAQAHGGDVTVQSIEGPGSVFRLTLPAARPGDRPDVRSGQKHA